MCMVAILFLYSVHFSLLVGNAQNVSHRCLKAFPKNYHQIVNVVERCRMFYSFNRKSDITHLYTHDR